MLKKSLINIMTPYFFAMSLILSLSGCVSFPADELSRFDNNDIWVKRQKPVAGYTVTVKIADEEASLANSSQSENEETDGDMFKEVLKSTFEESNYFRKLYEGSKRNYLSVSFEVEKPQSDTVKISATLYSFGIVPWKSVV